MFFNHWRVTRQKTHWLKFIENGVETIKLVFSGLAFYLQ